MTARNIVTWPDRRLCRPSDPVVSFDEVLLGLVGDMRDTLNVAFGAGLAAPQIGVSQRVVIIKPDQFTDEMGVEPIVMVNPRVELSGDKVRWEESCLSLPGVSGVVERSSCASVNYQDVEGNHHHLDATWPLAGAVQHECDHLEGKVYPMRMTSWSRNSLQKKVLKRQKQAREMREAREREMREDLMGARGAKKKHHAPRSDKDKRRAKQARKSRRINRRRK